MKNTTFVFVVNKRKPYYNRPVLILMICFILGLPINTVHAEKLTSKPFENVVLQLTWYHQFQFAGYYAAKIKGYYREEGLDVEIRERNPNLLPVDAVLSGKADFGNSNSDLVLLRMQGKPVVVVANIMQHSPWCLLVRADSGITVPEDLIGKTVSMDKSYRDVEILAMFKYEKIPTEKINIINSIPGARNLINGTVDARVSYVCNEPYDLQTQGYEPRVIRPVNYGIDFYGDNLFTSERQIRENPHRVAAFRRASIRGWQYAMDHPEEIIDYILSTYYANPTQVTVPLSREHLLYEATMMAEKLMHPELIEIGHINPKRWQRIADTYVNMGMVKPIDSLKGFIYDPNPKPNYKWIYWTIGIIVVIFIIIGIYATILFVFNKRLNLEIQRRTSENKTLAQEIAERKKVEKRLKDTEKKNRAWLENSPICTKIVDLDFNLQYMSAAGIKGLKIDDITQFYGKPYPFDFYPESFRNVMTKNLEKVKETGEIITQEASVVDIDGNDLWFHSTLVPVNDDEGRIDYFIVVSIDITERRQAEEGLRESEEKYYSLIANIPSVTWITNSKGETTFISPNIKQIYGYTPEEILEAGESLWFGRIHPEDVRMVKETYGGLFRKNSNFDVEYRIKKKDGEWIWLYDRAVTTYEKGGIQFAYGVFSDITERKKAEEQITASLREKEILLQEIHHRVKNNLQVIVSLLRLQSKNIKDQKILQMFQESQDRINSMALVHEKIYRSKDLARIKLKGYVEDLANGLFRNYGVNTGKIALKIDVEDISIGIDTAIPCGLIINELLTNSLKYAFPEGRKGEIKIEISPTNEDEIEMIIGDNGIGLREEFDYRNSPGFGFRMIVDLVEYKLMGRIKPIRNEGMQFQILFKEIRYKERI